MATEVSRRGGDARGRAYVELELQPIADAAAAPASPVQFLRVYHDDDVDAVCKQTEPHGGHAERMRLLHVRLPRLMEKISSRREQRILSAARLIAWDVFHYLKIQAKKRIGARILLSRRNAGSKREYLRAWHRGFRHRRLCTSIDRALHWPLLMRCSYAWRNVTRHERLRFRYCHAVISSNHRTAQQRKAFKSWQHYMHHLRRLRQALRNIALRQSNVRPALNSWRAYARRQKELKQRLRRRMMGLKQAALNAWHEITEQLQQHRMYVYDKFSRRLRHRYLLRPFNTLRRVWVRGRSACAIQTAVRVRQAQKCLAKTRDAVQRDEAARGGQERTSIENAEGLMLARVAEMFHGKKGRKPLLLPTIREIKRLRGRATQRQQQVAAPSPRTRLLRPLLAIHDLDQCGTTHISHVPQIGRDLGFCESDMLWAVEAAQDNMRMDGVWLQEEDVKRLFDAAHLDASKGFVTKLRRTWREWRQTNVTETAKLHIRDITLSKVRRDAQVSFRLGVAGKPPHACSGCGEPFALYRQLAAHEACCAVLARQSMMMLAQMQPGGSSSSSARVTLTTLVHDALF